MHNPKKNTYRAATYGFAAALLMGGVGPGAALAADARPYDYYQYPDGTNLVELYSDVYTSHYLTLSDAGPVNRSKVMEQFETMELVHYFDFGGVGVTPYLCIPYGSINHVETAGSPVEGSTGLGDPLLGTVVVPVHDDATTFGISTGVHPPLGQYTPDKTVNMGQNRWYGYTQLGGMQHIWANLSAELYVDANFYARNTQAGTGQQVLNQDTSYQLQPWLRWNFQPGLAVVVGYSQSWGGAQRLDGANNGINSAAKQFRLDLVHVLTPSLTYTVLLSRDIAVDGGYQSDYLAELRFIHGF